MNSPFQICIFEDQIATDLTPYQLSRPCFTIPVGYFNLIERVQSELPGHSLSFLCNKTYEPYLKKHYPNTHFNFLNKSLPTLFINGRAAFSKSSFNDLIQSIKSIKNYTFINKYNITALFLTTEEMEHGFNLLSTKPSFEDMMAPIRNTSIVEESPNIHLISNWWDYITKLSIHLSQDFEESKTKSLIEGNISSFTQLLNDHQMFIDKQAVIDDFVIMDATKGPIYISKNVKIESFSKILGPCFIGESSIIKAHSSISESRIGAHCKVGGEVNRSIFHSYSNKAHYGYLGDSLVGEWVNLGAGTTTSNLKLSYGHINSSKFMSNQRLSTDQQFLGSVFGDHVKTGIQSSFACGTIINSGSSLFGTTVHSNYIPPFTWGEAGKYELQQTDSLFTSIDRMMARRKLNLSSEEKIVLRNAYVKLVHTEANI